jgi:hypothetical protein
VQKARRPKLNVRKPFMSNILNIRLEDRKWSRDRLLQAMTSLDIYVQITAFSQSSGRSRSVIVLVPRANIENFRRQRSDAKSEDYSIAKILAEPLAGYAFTHRTIFSDFELSHFFLTTPPSEIEGRSPNLSQSGLKAWVV